MTSPASPSAPSEFRQELEIASDATLLQQVRTAVGAFVDRTPLPPGERNKVVLAVDEAVANIIEHGYEDAPDGWIRIDLCCRPDALSICIRDQGKRFDPSRVVDPDIETHVRQGKNHGLGIFLMRTIMDVVDYNFEHEAENRLTLIKYFKGASDGGAET